MAMVNYEPFETNSPEYNRVHDLWRKIYGHPTRYICLCGQRAQVIGWQHGEDPSLPESYEAMCRSCHYTYDLTPEWLAKNRGENNHNAYHTEVEILEIRRLYATGQYTYKELGKIFIMSKEMVGCIIRRERWKHI
jgi:hypothetical protein